MNVTNQSSEKLLKVLFNEIKEHGLKISHHSKERLIKRGYVMADIARVLLTGKVVGTKTDEKGIEIEVLGKDASGSPVYAVFGRFHKEIRKSDEMVLVTMTLPTHRKLKKLLTA